VVKNFEWVAHLRIYPYFLCGYSRVRDSPKSSEFGGEIFEDKNIFRSPRRFADSYNNEQSNSFIFCKSLTID